MFLSGGPSNYKYIDFNMIEKKCLIYFETIAAQVFT